MLGEPPAVVVAEAEPSAPAVDITLAKELVRWAPTPTFGPLIWTFSGNAPLETAASVDGEALLLFGGNIPTATGRTGAWYGEGTLRPGDA